MRNFVFWPDIAGKMPDGWKECIELRGLILCTYRAGMWIKFVGI
jgi:hypothetical protein